jgi:hypothetical protein
MRQFLRSRTRGAVLAAVAAYFAACAPAPDPAVAPTPGAAAAPAASAVPMAGAAAPRTDTVRARPFDTGRMWTFDFPPLDYLQRTYGFRPTPQWLETARMGALRFATWCSASFVSAEGLVLTNHHCAIPTLARVQEQGENLLSNGFQATRREQERRVPDFFVEQLVSIEDVTARMTELPGETEQERLAAQQRVRAELQQPDTAARMRFQVVEFYNGARYARYGYRRYDDVRLVFAPEQGIAFYGGDPDNFTYPRFALDMALYRVYDDEERPIRPTHWFRMSARGPAEGEAVFVVGNPGSTQRQFTVAQLEFLRDVSYPASLAVLGAREQALRRIGEADAARALELRDQLFSIMNSQKAIRGRQAGLQDPFLFARKVDWERNFREAVMTDRELRGRYGARWDSLAAIQAEKRRLAPRISFGAYLQAGPLGTTLNLLRALDAPAMKERALLVDRRVVREQTIELEALLAVAQQRLGEQDPILRSVLAGRTPEVAARELVQAWTLADTTARQTLLEGGAAAVAESPDPVLRIAREVLPQMTELERQWAALQARETANRNALGRAFYAVYGTEVPPDATFTLRLADGVAQGYVAGGIVHPFRTTFYGLYDRAFSFTPGNPDYTLPPRWRRPAAALDLSTPYNMVSTNDIIGGNSGSPLLNRNLEVVGLAFDGNIYSLPGSFIFDETQNRTVSVHSAAMIAALRDVYGARNLVAEMMGTAPVAPQAPAAARPQ